MLDPTIRVHVLVSIAPLPVQLPATVPGKAAADNSNTWNTISTWDPDGVHGFGLTHAQPSQPFGPSSTATSREKWLCPNGTPALVRGRLANWVMLSPRLNFLRVPRLWATLSCFHRELDGKLSSWNTNCGVHMESWCFQGEDLAKWATVGSKCKGRLVEKCFL